MSETLVKTYHIDNIFWLLWQQDFGVSDNLFIPEMLVAASDIQSPINPQIATAAFPRDSNIPLVRSANGKLMKSQNLCA